MRKLWAKFLIGFLLSSPAQAEEGRMDILAHLIEQQPPADWDIAFAPREVRYRCKSCAEDVRAVLKSTPLTDISSIAEFRTLALKDRKAQCAELARSQTGRCIGTSIVRTRGSFELQQDVTEVEARRHIVLRGVYHNRYFGPEQFHGLEMLSIELGYPKDTPSPEGTLNLLLHHLMRLTVFY